MKAPPREVVTLLRLRWRLLRRSGIRGGPARNRGGSFIVGGLVAGALLLQFSILIVRSLTVLLSRGLGDSGGRAALTTALAGLSVSLNLFLFLLALPATLALLTYSSDLKLLLLTPLRPSLALGEKFAAVYAGLVGLVLALGLPIVIGIGSAAGVGVLYYPAALLVLLLLPALPVALALLLTVAVLRWAPPARARAITAVLGALLSGGIYVGTQLLANRSAYQQPDGPPRLLTGVGGGPWSLLPVAWPGRALGLLIAGDGGAAAAYLGAAVLCGGLLAVLAVVLSARLFASGWATYQDVGRRTRRPAPAASTARPRAPAIARDSRGDLSAGAGSVGPPGPGAGPLPGRLRQGMTALPGLAASPVVSATGAGQATDRPGMRRIRGPAWWPLVGKEWRILRRDPRVWARLLYALVVIGFLFWQNLSRASLGSESPGALPVSLGSLGFFGLLCFLLWLPLTTLALSAVNREGRSLFLLALAPVSARDILLAKWVFAATPSLVLAEALLLAGAVVLRLGPGQVALGACALASIGVAMAGALLLVSLIWPRLDWDNPRRQVSMQASLAGSFGGLAYMAASGGLLVLTLFLAAPHPLLALACGAALFALTGLTSVLVLFVAPRRLQALLTAER